MRILMNTVLLAFLFPLVASGYEIAFIEVRDSQGRVVQLEKNGQFAHIAIQFRGQWLHAHPYWGVQLVSRKDLEKNGRIAAVVLTPGPREPDEATVRHFLGKPYDQEYSWSDDKIYCSELIAKIMGLPPEKMAFIGNAWSEKHRRFNGLPGISPDDIFRRLQRSGCPVHRPAGSCAQILP